VLSGLELENAPVGMRLPALYARFFADLKQLQTDSPELLAAVSEIRINKKQYEGFDLVLYPEYNKVRIRLSSHLTEDSLKYMLLVLDVLEARGIDVREIDFRTGTASYTMLERAERLPINDRLPATDQPLADQKFEGGFSG
jgi:cell division protein FtsQ